MASILDAIFGAIVIASGLRALAIREKDLDVPPPKQLPAFFVEAVQRAFPKRFMLVAFRAFGVLFIVIGVWYLIRAFAE